MLAGRMHFHLVALELIQLLSYRRLQGGQKSSGADELRLLHSRSAAETRRPAGEYFDLS